MTNKVDPILLRDGTLVKHRISGYQGKIEGTTEIKGCFTKGGFLLSVPVTKETFQYRIVVTGESSRHIAPYDDLEILEESASIVCFGCHYAFRSKPDRTDKAGGRCQCGGWICPSCLTCRPENTESSKPGKFACLKQHKRWARKLANEKKAKSL